MIATKKWVKNELDELRHRFAGEAGRNAMIHSCTSRDLIEVKATLQLILNHLSVEVKTVPSETKLEFKK